MCFRQRNHSERDYRKHRYRQWTNGKHSNQNCARAFKRGNTLKIGLTKSFRFSLKDTLLTVSLRTKDSGVYGEFHPTVLWGRFSIERARGPFQSQQKVIFRGPPYNWLVLMGCLDLVQKAQSPFGHTGSQDLSHIDCRTAFTYGTLVFAG